MNDDFAMDDVRPVRSEDRLLLDLQGFEGPLDLLLALARDQKVDITKISILQLAEQYLEFMARARSLQLEVAADYLVMAAWLAYLKSRLLLPRDESADEPSGAEMAAALTFQLKRLEALREAAGRLMARPQLGRERFVRGAPESATVVSSTVFEVSLFDLLSAYARNRQRADGSVLRIVEPAELMSIEEARERLKALLGNLPDWTDLVTFLPPELRDGLTVRSAVASTLVASLEMARSGNVEIRQDRPFGPVLLRDGRTR
ncbi:MAG: segregation/condensation protein A [Rhodospirillaceae bacterium]|nr:ScpA family protein [Rhodospirillaceae bacterium]MXW91145.1 segregation/condensation protein A [Rhodospirillaceae bacterium]MYB11855.1 segregation/condensation protein A [Rhodospirillaceae bacterium]MYI48217.1 segregation/condensation protein A [Rhodospirillaceae bacterium]